MSDKFEIHTILKPYARFDPYQILFSGTMVGIKKTKANFSSYKCT